MANQEHLNMLKQGVEVWNQWRQEQQDVIPDLSNAHLNGAYLNGASITSEQLGEARSLKDTIMPDGSRHPW